METSWAYEIQDELDGANKTVRRQRPWRTRVVGNRPKVREAMRTARDVAQLILSGGLSEEVERQERLESRDALQAVVPGNGVYFPFASLIPQAQRFARAAYNARRQRAMDDHRASLRRIAGDEYDA